MKFEPVTVEELETRTGRPVSATYQKIIDATKISPVFVSGLEHRGNFGSSIRAAARRQGINLKVRQDKKDPNAVFVIRVLDDEDDPEPEDGGEPS